MYKVKIVEGQQTSKVQQIANAFIHDIETGRLKKCSQLPSINRFAKENGVARDTIEKAYQQLKKGGYIASYSGRGYFVVDKSRHRIKVLLVFKKLNPVKKIIYEVLLKGLGKKAQVDLGIHLYHPKLLNELLGSNLTCYDYYVVMPHFFTGTMPVTYPAIIKMLPQEKLILLDKHLAGFSPNCNAICQDLSKHPAGDISKVIWPHISFVINQINHWNKKI